MDRQDKYFIIMMLTACSLAGCNSNQERKTSIDSDAINDTAFNLSSAVDAVTVEAEVSGEVIPMKIPNIDDWHYWNEEIEKPTMEKDTIEI